MGVCTAAVYYGADQGLILLAETAGIEISEMLKNIICLIPSMMVAVAVYFALVIKLGAVREKDLKSMPKGHLLLKIAKKLHLI